MDLTVFIEGIEALEELMPSVLSFVNKVHPGSDQETQKAATAVALTSSVLTSVGVAASTVEQLKSGIQAAASAPTVTHCPNGYRTATNRAAAGVQARATALRSGSGCRRSARSRASVGLARLHSQPMPCDMQHRRRAFNRPSQVSR